MNERGPRGNISAFAPNEPPKPDIPFNPDAIATALDGLRLAIWKHKVRQVPENLFDLPNEVHRAWNSFFKSWPDRRRLRADYNTESVKFLINMYDLQDFVRIDKIETIQELFNFLNILTEDYILDPLREILGEALHKFCRTDADREQLLKEALQGVGFENVSIKFNNEALSETIKTAKDMTDQLPKIAPKLYKERDDRTQNPAQFIKEFYREWVSDPNNMLPRMHIRHLDEKLYNSYNSYLQKCSRNKETPELYLPTESEIFNQKIANLPSGSVEEAKSVTATLKTRERRARAQGPR
ncbi:hypothetical protein [Methylobacterium tarhaniae]|uniref:hypothetical protein n=1 Tax=Methylobacterium tarhaniae TaxID=1187852 RepID=UPI003D0316EE